MAMKIGVMKFQLIRTESSGKSFRAGIRGDKLSFGLGWDPSPDLESN